MKKNNIDHLVKIKIENRCHVVIVKKNNSRYWRLRIGDYNKELGTYDIVLSSPRRLSDDDALKIINDHIEWLKKQLEKKQTAIVLNDGEAMLHGEKISIEEFNQRFFEEIGYITRRYNYLSKLAKVDGVSLKFRKMKSRWGSYNKNKKLITLNKWLVVLPYDLIDYVICHELTHHYVFNHSKDFYNQLAKLYPDYLVARKAIKNYSGIV